MHTKWPPTRRVASAATADEKTAAVAARVAANLRAHLAARGDGGAPLVFVSQGDPPAERGVTPVLRLLAEEMGAPRVVVTLPAEIDPEHAPNADREGAAAEIDYEDLAALLRAGDRDDGGDGEGHAGADAPRPATLERLEEAVGALIATKNAARAAEGKPPLKGYYYDYALLQVRAARVRVARPPARSLVRPPARPRDPAPSRPRR